MCAENIPLAFNRHILNSAVLILLYIQHNLHYIVISSNNSVEKQDRSRASEYFLPFPFSGFFSPFVVFNQDDY